MQENEVSYVDEDAEGLPLDDEPSQLQNRDNDSLDSRTRGEHLQCGSASVVTAQEAALHA